MYINIPTGHTHVQTYVNIRPQAQKTRTHIHWHSPTYAPSPPPPTLTNRSPSKQRRKRQLQLPAADGEGDLDPAMCCDPGDLAIPGGPSADLSPAGAPRQAPGDLYSTPGDDIPRGARWVLLGAPDAA